MRRVSFVIMEAGGGHRSVAEAIRGAVDECYGESLRVEIVEFPGRKRGEKKAAIPALYEFSTRRFLPAYDLMWHFTDQEMVVDGLTPVLFLAVKKKLAKLLESRTHDLLVAGNAILGSLLCEAREALGVDIPILVVVSDLASIHRSWTCPKVDLTIVPTDLALHRLLDWGIEKDKLIQTEFPIYPKFLNKKLSAGEARQMLGLDPERFTTLVTGGGAGSGLLEYYVKRLRSAFPEDQLLVVTGSNKIGYYRLKRRADDERVKIYQRVGNMDDLICASDVVVTKAGPSTMMECLALDRNLIVTRGVWSAGSGKYRVYAARSAGAQPANWRGIGKGDP